MKKRISIIVLICAILCSFESNAQNISGLFNALKGNTNPIQTESSQTTDNSTNGNNTANTLGSILGALTNGETTSSNNDGTAISTNGIVSGLLGAVLDAFTTIDQNMLIGTWNFKGSAFIFESENALANLGSDVIASQAEEKVDQYLAKLNIKEGMCSITFNEDNTCILTAGQRNLNGVYEFNTETKELKITYAGLFSTTANLVYDNETINIVYQSDGLLKILKAIGNRSTNTTLTLLNKLLDQYDGLRIGMAFSK